VDEPNKSGGWWAMAGELLVFVSRETGKKLGSRGFAR
jgi:hypothetical protein